MDCKQTHLYNRMQGNQSHLNFFVFSISSPLKSKLQKLSYNSIPQIVIGDVRDWVIPHRLQRKSSSRIQDEKPYTLYLYLQLYGGIIAVYREQNMKS